MSRNRFISNLTTSRNPAANRTMIVIENEEPDLVSNKSRAYKSKNEEVNAGGIKKE